MSTPAPSCNELMIHRDAIPQWHIGMAYWRASSRMNQCDSDDELADSRSV
uniref:Uncharacterized protein n=1 Tax=Arundo donax TaxID=35708 RepID=A0A0A9AAN0_ARUDO